MRGAAQHDGELAGELGLPERPWGGHALQLEQIVPGASARLSVHDSTLMLGERFEIQIGEGGLAELCAKSPDFSEIPSFKIRTLLREERFAIYQFDAISYIFSTKKISLHKSLKTHFSRMLGLAKRESSLTSELKS